MELIVDDLFFPLKHDFGRTTAKHDKQKIPTKHRKDQTRTSFSIPTWIVPLPSSQHQDFVTFLGPEIYVLNLGHYDWEGETSNPN